MTMDIQRKDLERAADEDLLSNEQAHDLWAYLEQRHTASPPSSSWFDPATIAYYGGALIVIAAMCWFMIRVSDAYGHANLVLTALVYGAAFVAAGTYLRTYKGLEVAGGLLFVLAVAMVPVVLYNLERATELWHAVYVSGHWIGLVPSAAEVQGQVPPWIERLRESWLLEEVGTLVAGVLALRRVRFPFLTVPVAVAVWGLMARSLPNLLLPEASWETQLWISAGVGGLMLVGAYAADRRTERDYAFWGYLGGLVAFWGSLALMEPGSEWGYVLYALVHVFLLFVGIFLERRAFLVFGALGLFQYVGHLAYEVFAGSVYFPLALSGLGLSLIYLGVKYQQNRATIERLVWSQLPASLRALSPRQR